jgi:ABC-type multidrug transport system fused ATPase/permease subunit
VVAAVEEGMMSTASAGRELGVLLWKERGMLLVALACAVVGPVAAMGVPIGAKLVIDQVIGRGRAELLIPISVGASVAVLLQVAASYGATQAASVAGLRSTARLRRRLQVHLLALPVGYFDATPTGSLVARCLSDSDQVRLLLGPALIRFVSGGITASCAFAILLWLEWRLAVFAALILAVAVVGLSRGFAALHPAFRLVAQGQAGLGARLTELLSGIRVMKAANAERGEALALTRENHELLRVSVRAYRHAAALTAATALAAGGVSISLLVLGGQAVARGALTLGDLALFVFLVGLVYVPLLEGAAMGADMGRAVAALGRIREVLSRPTERSADRSKRRLRAIVGTVAFDSVSYRYGCGPLVLRDVSFVAQQGTMTALVGPNGAGKSTVAGLLLGFDEPSIGKVLVDGRPLSGLRVGDYRRHIGVVLQRDHLLDGTIAENIRYGRSSASSRDFHRATCLAHCDEFVGRLALGYDTRVGERGIRLSGGQRQRVAIARAFLADPRILVLDEVTAHLDLESEQLIREAIAALCIGRTTFVIAHRLATIERANQILVLQSGAVVERGTHEELVGRRGLYWATCKHCQTTELRESDAEPYAT